VTVLDTCSEKRRCATLRPPRRLEICGLSARIVLFLSTWSCVYSRFNSACGQVHRDISPVSSEHRGYTCIFNGTTVPLGLYDSAYQHSVPSASSRAHCQPNALLVDPVRLCDCKYHTAALIHLPYVTGRRGLDTLFNLTTLNVSSSSLKIASSPRLCLDITTFAAAFMTSLHTKASLMTD
jgi:hypothetical protein